MKRKAGLVAVFFSLFGLAACGGVKSPDFVSTLKGVEIVPSTPLNVAIGGTLQLNAEGLYTVPPGSGVASRRAAVSGVTWDGNTPAVGTVDAGGLVKGVTCGVLAVTANVKGLRNTRNVTVGGRVLRSIEITPSTSSVHVGESTVYEAKGTYVTCNGSQSTGTETQQSITGTVTWSVVDANAATLTPNGNSVSAKGIAITAGTKVQARITNEEGKAVLGEATLVVNPALLKDLVISGVNISPPYRVGVGGSLTFSVMGIYSDSNTPKPVPSNPSPVTWTSSNTTRATFATAVSNTQNTLTAQSRDPNPDLNTFNITVSAPDGEGNIIRSTQPQSITVTDATLQSVTDIVAVNGITPLRVARGGSVQLVARGMFSDGSTQNIDYSLVTWGVTPGASPTGNGTITNFNANSTPPVSGGLLAGTVLGNVDVTATVNSATGTKFISRTATVTDPICVSPYVDPATATGTISGGPCLGLPNACTTKDAGNLVSPSQTDFATMTLAPTAVTATLAFNVTGASVTAAVGQKAGFIIAYRSGQFSPDLDLKIAVGSGPAIAPEVTALDPTSDGLLRRLVRVPVSGSFTAISGQVTVPAVVGTMGPTNPTGLVTALSAGGSVDVRFFSGCSATMSPAP